MLGAKLFVPLLVACESDQIFKGLFIYYSCIISCSLKVVASFWAISALFFDTSADDVCSSLECCSCASKSIFFVKAMRWQLRMDSSFLSWGSGEGHVVVIRLSPIEETELAGRVLQTDKHRWSRDLEHGGPWSPTDIVPSCSLGECKHFCRDKSNIVCERGIAVF